MAWYRAAVVIAVMADILRYNNKELTRRILACNRVVKRWQGMPLIWGAWDCAHLCADMAVELGFSNPMKYWPKYNSLLEARKTLKKKGFETLTEAVTSKLKPIAIGELMPSDIVEIKSDIPKMNALGIWLAPDAVVVFGEDKVQRVDMQHATGKAWELTNA